MSSSLSSSPCCRECGHKPPPDARFCDQCGVQIRIAEESNRDEPVSVPKALNMPTALLHSNFDAVFERMREAKRTSKSLSVLFRSCATQEQKRTMDMKKALASFSCNEPESKSLCEFMTLLNFHMEKQGRLSLMFADCLLNEIADNLNQLRLQLKQHHKMAVDAYNKALKALAASDSAIQKCRDRIARIEKQAVASSPSSNLISAARAAVGNDRQTQSLAMAKAELEKALAGRELSSQAIISVRASILKEWEPMEKSRMTIIVESIERGLILTGSLLRQKVAFNFDLLRKLKSVSIHDDIDSWVQKFAVQAPQPMNTVVVQSEVDVQVDAPAAPPLQEELLQNRSQSAQEIFVWVPKAESKQFPLLAPTIFDAKLLALCFCYRSTDTEQQRYYRRYHSVQSSAMVELNNTETCVSYWAFANLYWMRHWLLSIELSSSGSVPLFETHRSCSTSAISSAVLYARQHKLPPF